MRIQNAQWRIRKGYAPRRRAGECRCTINEGLITIPLTRGLTAICDEADHAIVCGRLWAAAWRHGLWYAADGRGYMHRAIMATPSGSEADHLNGDGLDNRRANLRNCDHVENMRNWHRARGKSSRYRGVYFRSGRWSAQIYLHSRTVVVGSFATEEEAAAAYDAVAAANGRKTNRQVFGLNVVGAA